MVMRRDDGWTISAVLRWTVLSATVACSACSQSTPRLTGAAAGDAAMAQEGVATIQELMRYEVDASADPIWDSVGSITTKSGTVERRPRTDAEWAALRQHAVMLLEATNLLVVPGRRVSARTFPSDGPGVLSSEQIQQRLLDHRAEFDGLAVGLRVVARQAVAAIDAKDPAALQKVGEAMDEACEACHLANWYPREIIPSLPANPAPPP
jgi:hypothetical protein